MRFSLFSWTETLKVLDPSIHLLILIIGLEMFRLPCQRTKTIIAASKNVQSHFSLEIFKYFKDQFSFSCQAVGKAFLGLRDRLPSAGMQQPWTCYYSPANTLIYVYTKTEIVCMFAQGTESSPFVCTMVALCSMFISEFIFFPKMARAHLCPIEWLYLDAWLTLSCLKHGLSWNDCFAQNELSPSHKSFPHIPPVISPSQEMRNLK